MMALIVTLVAVAMMPSSQLAHATTNGNLNFQARLMTNTGSIVPDGYYNIQFKLYDVDTGGSALWTETYLDVDGSGGTSGDDYRVRVKNGYLTVNLGSRTAFGNINWDQNLWITMNVGGTTVTATPTWNGEMSPRLKLTGVPYAFRAGMLATGNGTLQSTLQLLQPTVGNQVFQVRDQAAAGTYNLLTENEADAGYIQNATAIQTANFSIQSAAAGSVGARIYGAASQTADILQVRGDGVTNALLSVSNIGAVNIQPSADTVPALTIKSATGNNMLTIDSSNSRVGIGLGSNTLPSMTNAGLEMRGSIKLTGGTSDDDEFTTPQNSTITTRLNIPLYDPGQFNQIIAIGLPSGAHTDSRVLTLLDNRAGDHQPSLMLLSPDESKYLGLSWDGSNTEARIKNNADVTAIRNSGLNIVTARNSSGSARLGVGNDASAAYALNVTGTVNASGAYYANGTIGATTTCSGGNFLQDATVVGGIVTGGTCASASGSGVTTVGTFSGSSQANGASISGNTITFGPADGTNPGMVTTGTQTFAGAKTFTGAATFQNATDSTTAFAVKNTSGAGGKTVLGVDTTNLAVNAGGDVNVGSAANRSAGRLFSDGFESGNLKLWSLGTTTSGSSTVATDTTIARNGKHSVKMTNSSGAGVVRTSINGGTTTAARTYVYVSSQTSGDAGLMTLIGGANYFGLYRQSSNGRLAYWNGPTLTAYEGSTVLTTGAWHKIELVLTIHNSTGSATVYIDDVAVLTETGLDTGTTNPTTLRIGDDATGVSHVAYFDDVSADVVRPGDSTNLTVNDSLHVAGTSSFGGAMLLQPASNSTTAFQISNAAGTSLMTADTVNSRIGIGLQASAALAVQSTVDTDMTAYFQGRTNQSVPTLQIRQGTSQSGKALEILTGGGGLVFDIDQYGNLHQTADADVGGELGVGVAASSGTQVLVDAANGNIGLQIAGNGTEDILRLLDNSTQVVTVTSSGSTTFQNSTDSTSAFSIKQTAGAGGGTVFGVNTTNGGNISLLGNNSSKLSAYTDTTAMSVGSAGTGQQRVRGGAVAANGYLYHLGGLDGAGTALATVQYAKLNADGTVGTWASTTALPDARKQFQPVVANGYIYVIGGRDNSNNVEGTSYYAKLNSDGTIGSWVASTPLYDGSTAYRFGQGTVSYNGYIYVIGGFDQNITVMSTVLVAEIYSNGTLGSWSTTSTLPETLTNINGSTIANGYVYVAGGYDGSSGEDDISRAKLNADGTLGSWTAQTAVLNSFGGGDENFQLFVANGYLYVVGGDNDNRVVVFGLNADGSVTSGTGLTDLPVQAGEIAAAQANGYFYVLGGSSSGDGSGTARNNVSYASVPRVSIGGSLDLVAYGGENLSEGRSGGTLTAGNTSIIGMLDVQDAATFARNVAVGGDLTVANTVGANELRLNAADDSGNSFSLYSATGDLVFYNGAIRGVMTASGELGLGPNLTSPQARLDVDGDTGDSIRVTNDDDNTFALMINNTTFGNTNATGFGFYQGDNGHAIIGNNNALAIDIDTSGNTLIQNDATVGGDFVQSGANTFATATGAVSLNGDTTIASGKNLTVTAGATELTGPSAGSWSALEIFTGATTNAGLIINAAASQTADLLDILDGGAVSRFKVDAEGAVYAMYKPTANASAGSIEVGSIDTQSSGDINGVIGFVGYGVQNAQIAYSVGDGFYLCNSSASAAGGDYGQCASRVNLYGQNADFNGTFVQSGTGTFQTGTGTISLNGDTSIAAGKNLGVGTANAQAMLHVLAGGTAGTPAVSSATVAVFQRSSASGTGAAVSIISGNASTNNQLNFGDTDSETAGGLTYDHAADELSLRANGSDRLTITATNDHYFTNSNDASLFVETRGSNATGRSMTLRAGDAGAGGSDVAGGVLTLQGGAGNGTNGAGGGVTISGGSPVGSGSRGTVNIQSTAGNVIMGNSTGSIALNGDTTIAGGKSLVFAESGGSETVTLQSGATSASYTMILPTVIGGTGDCLKAGTVSGSTVPLSFGACGTGGGGGSSTFQNAYDNSGTADPQITLSSTFGGIEIVDGTTPVTGNMFSLQNNAGTASYFGVAATGMTLQNSSGVSAMSFENSTNHLKIYNPSDVAEYVDIYYDGTNNEAVFSASSGATRIGGASGNIALNLTQPSDVLTATKTGTLSGANSADTFSFVQNMVAGSNALTGSVVKIDSTTTGSNISSNILSINQQNTGATGNLILATTNGSVERFKVSVAGAITASGGATLGASSVIASASGTFGVSSNSGNLTLTAGGANKVIVKPGTNSASSFEVQNAGSTSLFAIDTTDNKIQIGSATTNSTAVLLILDSYDQSTDPTGTAGAMYYNTNLGRFRCYENGAWRNCLGTWYTLMKTSDESRSNNTMLDDSALAFTMAASTEYSIRCNIVYETTATPDFKYATTGPTSPTLVRTLRQHTVAAAAAFTNVADTAATASTALTGNGNGAGYIKMDTVWHNGSNSATWAFQWAQNTTNATASIVRAGSYCDYSAM